jgi:hypothetical protein
MLPPVCTPPLQAALGPGGVVEGLSAGKGYVDMSTVDEATSTEIAAAVTAKGGRFLEVSGWEESETNFVEGEGGLGRKNHGSQHYWEAEPNPHVGYSRRRVQHDRVRTQHSLMSCSALQYSS